MLKRKLTEWKLKSKFARATFSQEGEDLIISKLLGDSKPGFYVDVGAHHPIRFSNTYAFYQKGWSGINVDPCPGCMEIFELLRPRDINLEVGVSDTIGVAPYYIFSEPALNGFSKERTEFVIREYKKYNFIREASCELMPVSAILEQHLPQGVQISFMTVDVEGYDLNVLKSNNWEKFRPQLIVAEDLSSRFGDIYESEILRFLSSVGYSLRSRLVNSAVFLRD